MTTANEPVAWMLVDKSWNDFCRYSSYPSEGAIPLYTHPAKTLTDDPLVNFKPVWQEKPELTLTDEEILEFRDKVPYTLGSDLIDFARAILRKAQEQ
jgi:hypothetical protein